MGYKAIFMRNIDFKDKLHRTAESQLEFAWIPYFRYLTTESAYLFSHLFYQDSLYSPSPLTFDPCMGGDAIETNPNLLSYNVASKAEELVKYV